jgi:hypothetical protein
MTVYVVLIDGAYGAQIDKIFASKAEAEAYRTEIQKHDFCYYFYIEEHEVI